MIKIKVFLGPQQQFSQSVLMNVTEPLQAFLPFAKKKFQLDSSSVHSYGFLVLNADGRHKELSLASSLYDLDLDPSVELVMIDKEKAVTESALRAKSPQEERRAQIMSMTGNLMFDKKKRWIVLEGPTLLVHKSQEEADPKKPVETVYLSEFTLVVDEKDKKKLSVDLVSTKSRKDTHQIKFTNEEESVQWMVPIKSGCASEASNAAASGSGSANAYFGVPIEKVTPAKSEIPYIVEFGIQAIEQRSMDVEGIFRLSGSQNVIDKLKADFNNGVMVDFSTVLDPHNITGVLKLWFRELPEPLLTYDLYESFIAAQQERDPNKHIRYLRHLLANLGKIQHATLKYLMAFLGRVATHSDENKMAVHNLATVFAPNLLRLREDNRVQAAMDTPYINGVIQSFIQDFDNLFSEEEPPELTPSLAKAIQDYTAENDNQLSFMAGDMLRVYQQGAKGWWYGEMNGKYGLFPGSYVQVQPINKKQQFLNEMATVRAKIAEEKRLIAALEDTKLRLAHEMESLKNVKETAVNDAKQLKYQVLQIIHVTPELSTFNSELEQIYSQLEAYHKTKMAMQQSRSNLMDELSTLKRAIATEPKFKKYKEKLTPLVDALVAKLDQEAVARKQVDEKKDIVFKDLTELRALIGHPPSRGNTPAVRSD